MFTKTSLLSMENTICTNMDMTFTWSWNCCMQFYLTKSLNMNSYRPMTELPLVCYRFIPFIVKLHTLSRNLHYDSPSAPPDLFTVCRVIARNFSLPHLFALRCLKKLQIFWFIWHSQLLLSVFHTTSLMMPVGANISSYTWPQTCAPVT